MIAFMTKAELASIQLAKEAITENVKISWQGTGTP
jgi:hypothetical protein